MAVKVGSARLDERGKISGGAAGDQTGNEVSTQDWYLHKKGWVVLRAKDPKKRKKIAEAMKAACANKNIGYDQSNRYGLYNAVKNKGFDPAKCTVKTETDCSATVRVCVRYAGIKVEDFNTTIEVATLMKTGEFDKLTDPKYTTQSAYLLAGDILVTKTSGHTVVALNDGAKANPKNKIAKPILKPGDIDPQVGILQRNLNKALNLENDKILKDDEIFGQKTAKALVKFKKKNNYTKNGATYDYKCETLMKKCIG